MTTLLFHFICLLIPSSNVALFCRDFSKESNIPRKKKIIFCLLPFSCLGNTNFNSHKFLDGIELVSVVCEDITRAVGLSQSKCRLKSRRWWLRDLTGWCSFPREVMGKKVTWDNFLWKQEFSVYPLDFHNCPSFCGNGETEKLHGIAALGWER